MIESFFNKRFNLITGALCLIYATIELFYVGRLPFVMDEFQSGFVVNKLATQIPYKGFLPYKTVLGHYIQLPALLLSNSIWSKFIYVKYEMIIINSVSIFFGAKMLAKHFNKTSIFTALVMLICMSTFLERSASLRVDMLTAWFGFFSLLFLLEKRMFVSGLLVGLSFLVSQKGVYYAFSSAFALCFYFIVFNRNKKTFKDIFIFGAMSALPIVLYFGLFGLLGKSFQEVSHQVIVANKSIALDTLYTEVREYWIQTIQRNPLFYVAVIASFVVLIIKINQGYKEFILLAYGSVLLGFCLWHKQPWPYFFVLLIPTGFVLITSLFSINIFQNTKVLLSVWIIVLSLAVVYPLTRISEIVTRDNGAQKNAIELSNFILKDGDRYLSGVNMIFLNKQTSGFEWLDRKRLNIINRDRSNKLFKKLHKSKLKIVIMTYRIRSLPRKMKRFLKRNYKRLHGNVHVYCPTILTNTNSFSLKFDEQYKIVSFKKQKLSDTKIDGNLIKPGSIISLKSGVHTVESNVSFRVCLEPKNWKTIANKNYAKQKALFFKPYKY